MPKSSELFPLPNSGITTEKDTAAIAALDQFKKDLSTTLDAVPASDVLKPIKTAVEGINATLKDLDTTKADKDALDKANDAIAALTKALETLKDESATADDIATANAAIKAANDAIDALKTSTQKTDTTVEALAKETDRTNRFIFTTVDPLNILNAAKVRIDGPGDIVLWSGATKGQAFLIADPLKKILEQSNILIAETGYTIGGGQLGLGIAATDRVSLEDISPSFAGGEIRFTLDDSKNWAWDISAAAGGGAKKRYIANGVIDDIDHVAIVDGATALSLEKAVSDRVIEIVYLQSEIVPTLTCDASDEFFIWVDDKVVASDDHRGTLDMPYSQALLVGKAGGWDVIAPSVGGGGSAPSTITEGDRIVSSILNLLPADQWTDWPSLTGDDAGSVLSIERIESLAGEDWTNRFELDRKLKRVKSLLEHRGLTFVYEVHSSSRGSGSSDRIASAVLASLPANQWVDWPLLTGVDTGKALSIERIESSLGDDWTDRFELNRRLKKVRALLNHTDVLFTYEVH